MEDNKFCAYCGGPVRPSNGRKPRRYCSKRCIRLACYGRNRDRENLRCKEWREKNPEKYAACKRRWNEAHPEAVLRHARRARLLWEYGITHEQYDAMWSKCQGCCQICRKPMPKGANLHVDHCHNTGRVRGLLCGNCNRMLGAAGDDPAILRAAALYLENAYQSSI